MASLPENRETQFWFGISLGFMAGMFLMLMMVKAVLVY